MPSHLILRVHHKVATSIAGRGLDIKDGIFLLAYVPVDLELL